MNKKKCFYYSSPLVKKNGLKKGVQQYKCDACGKHFTGGERLNSAHLWNLYVRGKQIYKELAISSGVSESTIKRKIKSVTVSNLLNQAPRNGVLLMDTTYWGRNWGLLVIMDAQSAIVIWRKYLRQESLADYKEGVEYLESKGNFVDGIVCDGLKGMFQQFSHYKVQMCQFHQVSIIRRYITNNPKLEAGK